MPNATRSPRTEADLLREVADAIDGRLSAVEAQADRIEAKIDQALRTLQVTGDVVSTSATKILNGEVGQQ